MDSIDLMSKQSKMLSYVVKHSKLRKTTNEIKLQWIASIWHQNDLKCWDTSQNYKYDHITMNLHRFDVKTITTTQNYESDQIIMHCINLTSKRSKKLSYVPKLQKWSNYNELHRFDVKTIRNVELRRKTFKTTQNYESHQITMNCIDLMSKTSNQRKTTKVILFRWISIDLTSKRSKMLRYVAELQIWSYYDEFASIWRQNDHNNAKLRKSSNYNELHRFDVKKIKPTQNYKSNQITINLHRFDAKTIKNVELRPKTTKEIKLQWIWSIWHQNDLKCWDTSQNYKYDHITMNLHRFDVKTITTTQNYESDQIIMHCINLTSKQSKKLSYVPKLQKWSNYNELHRFDVKTIRNVELRRKTFKTTQNYESHHITMNCIDLMSKTWNQRKTTKVILFRWISIDLTSKRSKMLRYVAKLQMWSYYDEFASIWCQNYQKCWVMSQNIQNNANLQNG